MALKVGIEILSAIPGKCGAVGNLWRNNMRLFPEYGRDMEFYFFVNSSLRSYYDMHFRDRLSNLHLVEVPVDPNNVLKKLLAQEVRIPRLMQKYGIDIYFTGSLAPLFYPVSKFTIFKITALQFFYVPEQVGKKQTMYHRNATPRKARISDLIIANSHYTKKEIVRLLKVPHEKVHVIYESVDHDLFNRDEPRDYHWRVLKKNFSIEYPFVLFISDLRPYKNPLVLIQAYEDLLKMERIPEDLLIIGNSILGYGEELYKYADKSQFSERIHFLPFHEPFDLLHFYRCASVFVYPSELETFGTPPLEAMACGTTVIVSNKTAVPEVAGNGAVHVDPQNRGELVTALKMLLTDEDFRVKMVSQGLVRSQMFSWRKHAEETVQLIRNSAPRIIG